MYISKGDSIFVTGHNGMVGSAICRALISHGYKNILTVGRSELDLTNELMVKNWFIKNKPNVVILAAAKVGGIMANSNYPVEFLVENIQIQNNLILNSYINKTKRFLFLGSSCIYPKFATQPIREESLLQSPLETTNEAYALAKITGIKLIDYMRKQKSFDGISLMPTNLYGRNDNYDLNNSHVLPALIKKIYEAKINNDKFIECWGTGTPAREFLFVDDLAEAVIFVLDNWNPSSNDAPIDDFGNKLTFLNVGTGIEIRIKDLVDLIKNKIGFEGYVKWDNSKPDGTPKKRLDTSRINKIGWYPKVPLEKGIEETIRYFIEENKNN